MLEFKEAIGLGYYGFIYKTTNLINGKIYIGQRMFCDSNWHNNNYLGSGKWITRAIKKHGRENFKREIIEYVKFKKDIDNIETKWIEFYDATNPLIGYNIAKYGSTSMKDFHHSDESKKKISDFNKKKRASKETREKMRNSWSNTRHKIVCPYCNKEIYLSGKRFHFDKCLENKNLTDIEKENIINSRKRSKEVIEKVQATKIKNGTNKPSEETKKKIGNGNRGKTVSQDVRNKISKANKGKIISEETKNKISNTLKNKKIINES